MYVYLADIFWRQRSFTLDNKHFAGLGAFVDELHARNMKYVFYVQPSMFPGYPAYEEGLARGVFVRNATGQPIRGLWESRTESVTYIDFSKAAARAFWRRQLMQYWKQLHFDGVLLNANAPINWLNGSTHDPPCPRSKLETPAYVPGGLPLATSTLCMTARQDAGLHYNVHAAYPWYQYVATSR